MVPEKSNHQKVLEKAYRLLEEEIRQYDPSNPTKVPVDIAKVIECFHTVTLDLMEIHRNRHNLSYANLLVSLP